MIEQIITEQTSELLDNFQRPNTSIIQDPKGGGMGQKKYLKEYGQIWKKIY